MPQKRPGRTQQARKPASRRPARRAAQRPVSRAGQRTTAMVVARPAEKSWLLSQDEVSILKNAVCKGASDEEMKYCLTVARRYELDPFQKQIWFVRRWDSEAVNSDGKKGGYIWTPQVSIDGLCHQAASYHDDYGSFSEPEYGPMITVKWQWKGQGQIQTLQAPEWARIEAWKKGATQPTVGKVWWSEIYPDIDYAPLVRRMPRLMLAKCAKAQAIRSAYPKKTGGLLIPEETQTREFQDITPGGRLITSAQPPETAEEAWKRREEAGIAALPPEQQEIIRRRMREAEEKKNAPIDIQPPRQNRIVTQAEVHDAMAGVAQAIMQDCLVYRYYVESNTYRIDGPDALLKQARDLLKPLWNKNANAIVANAKQLGALINQLELRKVPIRGYDMREPGVD